MVTALDAGADDYIVKPCEENELRARIHVGGRILALQDELFRSREQLRRQATIDSLTGLLNRRAIIAALSGELARAAREQKPTGVLMLDIDRFKQINDGYGHEVGNEVLRAFVARSDSCIRKGSDWLARVGGDEFLVVLPETNAIGASRVAQKLHRVFARFPVATHAGPVTFTASIGVTAVDADHEVKDASKIEDLLRAADRGLYASKKLGGNQATSSSIRIAKKPVRQPGGKNGIN